MESGGRDEAKNREFLSYMSLSMRSASDIVDGKSLESLSLSDVKKDEDLLEEPFRKLTEDDLEFFNHEVINVYLELLKERERREPKKFLKCHFFSTFFYRKLISERGGYDYKSVRRWTSQRKLGYSLLECDKIFVPVNKENKHWCLAVINKKEKKFQYLDSLGGIDKQVMGVLEQYIVDEVKDKNGEDIDVTSWKQEFVTDLPNQQNGFDCGVFMIKYADFYSRDIGLCFKQENMPYFRLRTAKEILKLRAD
ncbi:cysteine proteinases superfamily protein [Artemisia annua]|uniref:Cysteine proteinases superfamily protein n=1 Tax=Artemisia annua TaxID=35608 RepID=A0A2U1PBW2_ARTAN|nr:cysteine proteinases superfamily protein [Artemisia annua]